MKLCFAVLALLCADITYAASITWEPFELPKNLPNIRAQLGRVTVPLVRTRPDAGNAEIVFLRVQAGSTNPPIVYLAGGPGGSGISAGRDPRAMETFARLAQSGDVILLDQRGVGRSTPRPVCRPSTPLQAHEKWGDRDTTLARIQEATRACVAEWKAKGVDAAGFTNAESAADLDDLRKALGVPKISIFGFSYGTHLALAAVRAFGANIDRVVLIGTEGPNHTRKLPSTLDTQLGKLSLLAGKDMTATLRRVLEKLEREPLRITINDRAQKKDVEVAVGPDALRRILVADIGDGNDFPVFPALLETIDRGDPSILRWFVDKRYNQITGAIDLMVVGMECSSGATADRERQIRQEAERSPFGNSMNFLYPEVCAALPPVDLGDAFRGPLISDVQTLFISGTLDSNTPPFQAEELRWGLTRSTHLIVENAGHEDTIPNPDVHQAIADFFAGKDVATRRIALPAPRFMSVEDAKKDRK